jgi:hypothetical protein
MKKKKKKEQSLDNAGKCFSGGPTFKGTERTQPLYAHPEFLSERSALIQFNSSLCHVMKIT